MNRKFSYSALFVSTATLASFPVLAQSQVETLVDIPNVAPLLNLIQFANLGILILSFLFGLFLIFSFRLSLLKTIFCSTIFPFASVIVTFLMYEIYGGWTSLSMFSLCFACAQILLFTLCPLSVPEAYEN